MRAALLWYVLLLGLGLSVPAWSAPPAAAGRSVATLESTPPGAQVFDERYDPRQGTGYLGTTPLTLSLEAWKSHTLYFVRDGYSVLKASLPLGESCLRVDLAPATPLAFVMHQFRYRPLAAGAIAALILGGALVLAGTVHRRFQRLQQQLIAAELDLPSMPGRVIDDYRVLEQVGEGTFSRVFKVEHLRFRDVGALKIVKPEFLSPEGMSRFCLEMQLGRDLRHPNLVRVYAFGDFQSCPYLIMQYVPGRTLAQVLKGGRLTLFRTLEVFDQVCAGVACAHERGVVHRDLKPHNIMLGDDGSVHVLDFGIAHCLDRRRVTASGAVLGTPHYMSPEHATGHVDTRSDVYSLGAILFEMLTGEPPFDGPDAIAVITAHKATPLRSVRSLCPDVPPAVEAVVSRMLEKKPARRNQSLDEVRVALAEVRRALLPQEVRS